MRSAFRRMLTVLMPGAGLLACGETQAADTIYMSRSAAGFPTYATRPLNDSATPVFRFAPRPPSALAPAQTATQPYPPPQPARTALRRLPPAQLLPMVQTLATRHGVPLPLVLAVIDVESGFQPRALSSAGAMGLMQLMPATARRYGVVDPWDPASNLEGGIRYLRFLLDLFDGDLRLALAGYNAGEGAVMRHGRRIPPFKETQNYVPAVLARYRHWKTQRLPVSERLSAGVSAPVALPQAAVR